MSLTKFPSHLFVALLIVGLQFSVLSGQENQSDGFAKYMDDDVIGVVRIELGELNLAKTLEAGASLGFFDGGRLEDFRNQAATLSAEIQRLSDAGINQGFALLRTSDLQSAGTSWVFPLKKSGDSGKAKELVAQLLKRLPPPLSMSVDATPDAILAGKPSQLQRLKAAKAGINLPEGEIYKTMGGSAVSVALFGNDDVRRVIREMMPALPVPFESVTGEMVADQLKWAVVNLQLGQKPSVSVVIATRDDASAKQVMQLTGKAMEFLRNSPEAKKLMTKSQLEFVFDSIVTSTGNNRVELSTEKMTSDMDKLAETFKPQVKMLRAQAAVNTRLNNLRQLALANHNYESAFRHFPTQGASDDAGNLLLSWRVQILPFIGENELYHKFNHDEPWDSDHNIQLVKQMPKVFQDPMPESHANNKAGKTVYVGPAGKGMIFNGPKEVRFRDMTDGTSNTIMLVVVAQKNAVEWTKPNDWQVDFDNPTAQLKEDGRTKVEAAIADGSVHQFPINMDVKNWQRFLQYNDGEIAQYPK